MSVTRVTGVWAILARAGERPQGCEDSALRFCDEHELEREEPASESGRYIVAKGLAGVGAWLDWESGGAGVEVHGGAGYLGGFIA